MTRRTRAARAPSSSARPLGQIIRANVLTPYNALLTTLTVMVAITRRWPDTLIGLFVILNSGIGITQEVRARRALERLRVVDTPTVRVQRANTTVVIAVADLATDDVMILRSGDQVPADGRALSAGMEIDESLLSGESLPVAKLPGDALLSGSIVVAGTGTARVTAVGDAAYANRLTADIQKLRRTRSFLMEDTNRLLVMVIAALVVVGPLLLWGEFRRDAPWQDAVVDAAAAMGAMIPDGLVLLTSLSFLLAAARLARRGVLTHQLAAVEVLARADVLLLDKTGTLTDGTARVVDIELLSDVLTRSLVDDALGAIASEPGTDATLSALHRALPPPSDWPVSSKMEFSSARRWSAVSFADHGTWAIGAPELLLTNPASCARADLHASQGMRVLVLARSESLPTLPSDLEPVALILLEEQIRPGAPAAIAYLLRQGMAIKVISGDHPATAAAVARRVGVPHADHAVRFEDLAATASDGLAAAMTAVGVIGRVSPDQKRVIVRALQEDGHVVAMTGDGVNDALALKTADLGIAMAGGAPATRGLADLVLLNSDFTSLPLLVEEGRRVLGGIERVAHLFLVKVVYATIAALMAGIAARPYLFLPRQLTWTAALTIGIPGLVLAGERCNSRFRRGYLRRVLRVCVPAGALAAAGLFFLFEIASRMADGTRSGRAAASIAAVIIGLGVIELSGTGSQRQRILIGVMGVGLAATLRWPWSRQGLALDLPGTIVGLSVVIGIIVVGTQSWAWRRTRDASGPATRE